MPRCWGGGEGGWGRSGCSSDCAPLGGQLGPLWGFRGVGELTPLYPGLCDPGAPRLWCELAGLRFGFSRPIYLQFLMGQLSVSPDYKVRENRDFLSDHSIPRT